jgi:hypothetical protein
MSSMTPSARRVAETHLRRKSAKLNLQGEAYKIVRNGVGNIESDLLVLSQKAARAMKPHEFMLDERASGVYPSDGGSDGWMPEGDLVFLDTAALFRSEEQARKIFDDVLDAWPTRYGDGKWSVWFGK